MMNLTLHHRAPRTSFTLTDQHGVYALYLKPSSSLASIVPVEDGLIYIGKAAGRSGFRGRCHFKGASAKHSPRRSLAALLADDLDLVPKAVLHPDGSFKTWGLTLPSEKVLDRWMHDNLLFAVEPREDAAIYEKRMIWHYKPPLNLKGCPQSLAHKRVSELRRQLALRCRLDNASGQS